MGSRGPIGKPGGVRAERARKRAAKGAGAAAASKALDMPEWLPETAAATWTGVLRDLRGAGVVLAAIDGHAVGFYVLCIDGAREALKVKDGKLWRGSLAMQSPGGI